MSQTLNAVGTVTSRTAALAAPSKCYPSASVDMGCPSLVSRIVARLHARQLDRLVAAGTDPRPGSVLEAHLLRLRSAGHRERLAAELRRRGTVALCDRVMSSPPSRVHVPAVMDEADLIERIEDRLLSRHDVSPRGTARLRRLLADWTGPLRRSGSGDLYRELHAVLVAL